MNSLQGLYGLCCVVCDHSEFKTLQGPRELMSLRCPVCGDLFAAAGPIVGLDDSERDEFITEMRDVMKWVIAKRDFETRASMN